jgi:hypothetical protein
VKVTTRSIPVNFPVAHRWVDLDLLKWFGLHVVVVATKPHSGSLSDGVPIEQPTQ